VCMFVCVCVLTQGEGLPEEVATFCLPLSLGEGEMSTYHLHLLLLLPPPQGASLLSRPSARTQTSARASGRDPKRTETQLSGHFRRQLTDASASSLLPVTPNPKPCDSNVNEAAHRSVTGSAGDKTLKCQNCKR